MPKIPLMDRLAMSPWQKLIKYKRFPFKFVVHILLTILVTVQVFLFSSGRETYMYASGDTIVNRFLPQDYVNTQASGTGYNTFYFYKIDDLTAYIEKIVPRVRFGCCLCCCTPLDLIFNINFYLFYYYYYLPIINSTITL